MPIKFARQIRREQTLRELNGLEDELAAWFKHRTKQDLKHQYKTQLEAVDKLMKSALLSIKEKLLAMNLERLEGVIYNECRLFDLRILWLRRVWEFFKEKFDQRDDQRDDQRVAHVLQAADEVVWSCYRQVFVQLEQLPEIKMQPAPLPFIESNYSPEAFPSQKVPPGLQDTSLGESFLRDYLNALPLSVVRLPPICIHSPWWLVYLGHEMGHHVQYDLKLVYPFRDKIEAIVQAQDATPAESKNWYKWADEIFADIFSVYLMGQWAVRAMAELEMNIPEVMTKRRSSYPAPIVRLQLLADTATMLGLNGDEMLRGIDMTTLSAANAEIIRDLKFVPSIVTIASEKLPGLEMTLQELTDFRKEEFLPEESVAILAKALLDPENPPSVNSTLRDARLLTSALLAAWAKTLDSDDEVHSAEQREYLTKEAPKIIIRSGAEDTRAGEPLSETMDKQGRDLADLLLRADTQQLELLEG
ncbi:MAG: hypothetical protein NVSMB33_16520 [Ktedonobacteraceae bacterium]